MRIFPGFPAQWLHITHAHINVIAGHDVGHRSGKNIGALLLQQRGTLAFRLGLRIDALGFFALTHYALDHAIANADFHVIDGCIMRQRENVNGLNGHGAGVGVLLRDGGGSHEAAHIDYGVSVKQRDGLILSGSAGAVKQRAFAGLRWAAELGREAVELRLLGFGLLSEAWASENGE